MANRSYKILEARDEGRLTKPMKQRGIMPEDCHEAHRLFGYSVALQMAKDLPLYAFWDSASMIEQGWHNFKSKESVDIWVAWVFSKLGLQD